MQAVILAAGKGTRMQNLTSDTPKPLLQHKGKTLLEWKIERLPDSVDEVIIVIGYLGDKIKNHLGDSYGGKKITYVWDKEIRGTGMALWQTKDLLKDHFLVMMGDDIYDAKSIEKLSKIPWGIDVKEVDRDHKADRALIDENGLWQNFLPGSVYKEKYADSGKAVTGMWSLSKDIFNHPLVVIPGTEAGGNEWGLTHTIASISSIYPIEVVESETWEQITAPTDLK